MNSGSEATAPLSNAPASNTPVISALIAVLIAIGVVGYFAFINTGQSPAKPAPAPRLAEPAVPDVG